MIKVRVDEMKRNYLIKLGFIFVGFFSCVLLNNELSLRGMYLLRIHKKEKIVKKYFEQYCVGVIAENKLSLFEIKADSFRDPLLFYENIDVEQRRGDAMHYTECFLDSVLLDMEKNVVFGAVRFKYIIHSDLNQKNIWAEGVVSASLPMIIEQDRIIFGLPIN